MSLLILCLKLIVAVFLMAFGIGATLLGTKKQRRKKQRQRPSCCRGHLPQRLEVRRRLVDAPRYVLRDEMRRIADTGSDRAGIYVGSTPEYHRRQMQQQP